MPLAGLLAWVLPVLSAVTSHLGLCTFFYLSPHTQYPCLMAGISVYCHLTQRRESWGGFDPSGSCHTWKVNYPLSCPKAPVLGFCHFHILEHFGICSHILTSQPFPCHILTLFPFSNNFTWVSYSRNSSCLYSNQRQSYLFIFDVDL